MRPNASSRARNTKILEALKGLNADILILTETDSLIHPGEKYISSSSTPLLGASFRKQEKYTEGENRVTIWSRYQAKRIKTSNSSSTVCAGISTPLGELIVYGTVIGIYGRGRPEFICDLEDQIIDWQKISGNGNACIAGDFNQALGGGSYFTIDGRQKIIDCFQQFKIAPNQEVPRKH